jgi:DNA-binding IclR family transcriptional regulator
MDYTGVFIDMVAAYRSEIGNAFPSADPKSVLDILRECNRPEHTSQRQIQLKTRIPQSNVAKLVAKMIEHGWLEQSKRDPVSALKKIQITLLGAGVLVAFEEHCRRASRRARKT